MFEHTADSFLTIETGEAYQPVRLTYLIKDKDNLLEKLNKLKCIEKDPTENTWIWYWKNESETLNFQSIDSFQNQSDNPVRLATLSIQQNLLHIHLPSFKRACMAVPFFYREFDKSCEIQHADFLNKIFKNESGVPSKLDNLFKDNELKQSAHKRVAIYEEIEKQCESNLSMSDALDLMSDVIKNEAKWKLPQIERFIFDFSEEKNPKIVFLAFYLFMRSRELVLIKQITGHSKYKLVDAANEIMQETFGIDINNKSLNPIIFRAQALFRGYLTHGKVNLFC